MRLAALLVRAYAAHRSGPARPAHACPRCRTAEVLALRQVKTHRGSQCDEAQEGEENTSAHFSLFAPR